MKKILSVILGVSMVFANATTVIHAESTDNVLYRTVDITPFANVGVFAKYGDLKSDYTENGIMGYGKDYPFDADKFKSLEGVSGAKGKSVSWVTSWTDDMKTNTLKIGEVPYILNVTPKAKNGILTGKTNYTVSGYNNDAARMSGIDVNIADGNYTELKLLASAPNATTYKFLNEKKDSDKDNWTDNDAKLALKLDYTDGSYEIIDSLLVKQPGWGVDSANNPSFPGSYKMIDGTVPTKATWWNGISGIAGASGYGNGRTSYGGGLYEYSSSINEYTIPVNSSKVLSNVHIVGSCADWKGVKVDPETKKVIYSKDYSGSYETNYNGIYTAMVYAITGVTSEKTLKDTLDSALAVIGQAENNGKEITEEMINTAVEAANQLDYYEITIDETTKKALERYRATYELNKKLAEKSFSKIDLTQNNVANKALSAKAGEKGYGVNVVASSCGIDVDYFKSLKNRDNKDLTTPNGKKLEWKEQWRDNQTVNTLVFGDTEYRFDLETGGKATYIKTGTPEYWTSGAIVNIDNGFYNDIKLLASAGMPKMSKYKDNSYEVWGELSKLAVKLNYADGTWDIIDDMYTLEGSQRYDTWFDNEDHKKTGITDWYNGFGQMKAISNTGSIWTGYNEEKHKDIPFSSTDNLYNVSMNEYTIPVNSEKVLKSIEIVGSVADPAGVKTDENGNVIYGKEDYIVDNYGVYNNNIFAITGETDGKTMRASMLKETDWTRFKTVLDTYKVMGYPVDSELENKMRELNTMGAYFDEVNIETNKVTAKIKAFDSTLTGVCIAAIYDNTQNKLIECSVKNGIATSNDTVTFDFTETTKDRTIKLFYLDNFNNLTPFALCEIK